MVRRRAVVAAITWATVLMTGILAGVAVPSVASAKTAVAELHVLDRAAAVSTKAKPSAFKPVATKTTLAIGDTVKTNATGFAEVDYPDGSLTRLDATTKFTVTALGGTGPTKATLSQGEVWSEVQQATGSTPSFEIATPGAIAAVRGTAFAVSCASDTSCLFGVVDGTVDVTANGQTVSVPAGQQVGVDSSGALSAGAPLDLTVWIAQNQDQDRAEGRTPPAPPGSTSTGGFVEQAASSTPTAIAATLLEQHNQSAATPAPNSITAPWKTAMCSGSKALQAGDRVVCTAMTANAKTYQVRVVALDGSGKFATTSNHQVIDPGKIEQTAKIIGELDASGTKIDDITTATCEAGPVVVAIPGGTVKCHLVDSSGRSVDATYTFDGAGRATSSETFA